MIQSVLSLTLPTAMMVTIAVCLSPAPAEPELGQATIVASPRLDRISIYADHASRDSIFNELRHQGIDVRVSGLPDASVTLRLDDASIAAAVVALLQPAADGSANRTVMAAL
jgi:hypothetical protein